MIPVFIPHLGHAVVLVPREQLRRKTHGRRLSIPWHLKGLVESLPTPPLSFDGSKGRTIKYPILGNNRFGDCYYADMCHCVQTFTGNGSGVPVVFDESAVITRYKQVSGGDNGLGDAQVFPEWKKGIVGPSGPHKILDDMTIPPSDDAAIRLGMWAFCGCSYTASLLNTWLQNPSPGQVWDANGQPNPNNGHAMHLSGFDSSYYYDETWGFDPAIRLTPAGLKASDPEITVQFSLEMFNAQGIAPHNGMTYDQLATLWVQLGGATLPPSPFPPIGPPGPPPPPPVHVPPTAAQVKTVVDAAVLAGLRATLRHFGNRLYPPGMVLGAALPTINAAANQAIDTTFSS